MNNTFTLPIAKMFDNPASFPPPEIKEGKGANLGKKSQREVTGASSDSRKSRQGSQHFCLESFKNMSVSAPHPETSEFHLRLELGQQGRCNGEITYLDR